MFGGLPLKLKETAASYSARAMYEPIGDVLPYRLVLHAAPVTICP